MSSSSSSSPQALDAEVRRLVGVYGAWCAGTVDRNREVFEAQLGESMSNDFYIIMPWGDVTSKEDFIAFLKFGYGRQTGMEVTVEDFKILQEFETKDHTTLTLVSYREMQTEPKKSDVIRQTTALMETVQDGSIQWRHIHLSWTQPPQEEGGAPASGGKHVRASF
ncbi:expressed unknown protein [Seminavis robusta]|uniref:DUF4440 domain-containing protein n=1 Tax=Seminavis robusta TaxID=568900 RepID=A0A9N8ERJ2_9STRA|nr:expressed unknown protein [Seminavis robusta]|eukprot:Sro1633_g287350.1 n/a (165) ;mRNA; f:7303-7797